VIYSDGGSVITKGDGKKCLEHYLLPEEHCAELEACLQQVPGDFCEGEGDSPHDAVNRLRVAYESRESKLAVIVRKKTLVPQWDVLLGGELVWVLETEADAESLAHSLRSVLGRTL
jgi:hypothetical protein